MQLRAAITIVALVLSGCGGDSSGNWRYSREKAQKSLQKLEEPGLVIGEFPIKNHGVVDGDTIKVDGLDSSLRLLAIDTEEIFHHKDNLRLASSDFDEYLRVKRAESRRPPKTGTPMGVEAAKFAKDWFSGVSVVRLERDHPKEIRGRYNRYLAYVFAKKNGQWLNYNVECVRAGMAPYFTKYGYSRRFHDEFVKAEKEAREAKRGIWDPEAKSYRDYDVRREWWDARAEFIKKFEQDAAKSDELIALTNWDSLKRIEDHLGREVEILATVGKIQIGEKGPTKVRLSRRMFNDFTVIFWDRDVFGTSRIAKYKGEFVRVRGTVQKWHNKYNGRDELQLEVRLPSQVQGSNVPGIEEPK